MSAMSNMAVAQQGLFKVRTLVIDKTISRIRGHNYMTPTADVYRRVDIAVTPERTIERLAQEIQDHEGDPETIESVPVDMFPVFIKGVARHHSNAKVTFDKFHVIAHVSQTLDHTRWVEQKLDPALNGLRRMLLKDSRRFNAAARADLDSMIGENNTKLTTRAWVYRGQLREVLNHKPTKVERLILKQWRANVCHFTVESMKAAARLLRSHLEGLIVWVQTLAPNGLPETLNGLFRATKRKARGYNRFSTIRPMIFLIARKIGCSQINPYLAGQPT